MTVPADLRASDEEREERVVALHAHCRAGRLTVEELEERTQAAYAARTVGELEALTADLPAHVPAPATPAEPLVLRATLGETKRGGRWRVPARLALRAVLGEVEVDLRDAELPAGGVDVDARATLGTIRLLVPPGTPVSLSGRSVLGERKVRGGLADGERAGGPEVRIHGLAVLGEIHVDVATFGERVRGLLGRRRKR